MVLAWQNKARFPVPFRDCWSDSRKSHLLTLKRLFWGNSGKSLTILNITTRSHLKNRLVFACCHQLVRSGSSRIFLSWCGNSINFYANEDLVTIFWINWMMHSNARVDWTYCVSKSYWIWTVPVQSEKALPGPAPAPARGPPSIVLRK